MSTQTNEVTKVIPIIPKKNKLQSEKKWGKEVIALGFSILPSIIFRAQARLGLNSAQLTVLLHLADSWWHEDSKPFPTKATLAERMSLTPRQIQRHLTALEKAGFIEREKRFAAHKGQISNAYSLEGLVKKLKDIEPEITSAKKSTKQVTKRGGLKAMKA